MSGLEEAVLKLDSAEKFRVFILEALVDGVDRFRLIDRNERSAASITHIYKYLTKGISSIDATELEPDQKAYLKKLLIDRTDLFEDATLSLLFEFGRLGEFDRDALISALVNADPSPSRASGKLAERVIPQIDYDSIVQGGIRFGDSRYRHNTSLLGLLFEVQTGNIPGLGYWKKLQCNDDFINLAYYSLKGAKDPAAKKLIPRMVAAHHRNYGSETDRHKKFWANLYFFGILEKEFGDAYSQFLADPSNEFETTIKSIPQTPIKAPVPEVVAFVKGSILMLRSHRTKETGSEIDVVYIDDKIHDYNLIVNSRNPDFGEQIPRELHAPLAKMVRRFEMFRKEYLSHLVEIKSGK